MSAGSWPASQRNVTSVCFVDRGATWSPAASVAGCPQGPGNIRLRGRALVPQTDWVKWPGCALWSPLGRPTSVWGVGHVFRKLPLKPLSLQLSHQARSPPRRCRVVLSCPTLGFRGRASTRLYHSTSAWGWQQKCHQCVLPYGTQAPSGWPCFSSALPASDSTIKVGCKTRRNTL